MYKLEHFLAGAGLDHEFATVGFTNGSVENMKGIDEDSILDTLCHKGGKIVKHERFAIVNHETESYACCSIKENISGLGYFVKVYFVGNLKKNGPTRGIKHDAIFFVD
jgi:hypothetical protein